jgi:hypothetical protein
MDENIWARPLGTACHEMESLRIYILFTHISRMMSLKGRSGPLSKWNTFVLGQRNVDQVLCKICSFLKLPSECDSDQNYMGYESS